MGGETVIGAGKAGLARGKRRFSPQQARFPMMKSSALSAILLGLLALPAAAQTAAPVSVAAKAGQEVRAGWVGSVGADCKPNPAPTLTPSKLAAHGQIKLQQADVKTNSFPACPGITVPAVVVFYTSSPGFKGSDAFTLTTADGTARAYSVTVD